MKIFFNKKIVFITIIMFAIILINGRVQATGGQAAGTTDSIYNKNISYLFEFIRAMETSTGTLGVDSNIDTSSTGKYVDTVVNGKTNNIDCHLEKNTEYGTATLLAASDFGNTTSTDSESTANNGTGIYQMGNNKYEFTASVFQTSEENTALLSTDHNKALLAANPKYLDTYVGMSKQSKDGDGIIDTEGWDNARKTWRKYFRIPSTCSWWK